MSADDGLAAFVTARLDEWEATAKATAPSGTRLAWRASHERNEDGMLTHWVTSDPNPSGVAEALGLERDTGGPVAEHIALHDPASTLLLVASLREIVQRFVQLREYAARPYDAESTSVEGLAKRRGYLHALEVAIEGFAGIWSTHPEYQERWKP